MPRSAIFFLLPFLLIGLLSPSCKKPLLQDQTVSPDSSYFSIRQFINDQVRTHYGNPWTLYRVVSMGGKEDSTLLGVDAVDWASIFNTFSATDISPRKFLGKYNFSMSDDNTTGDRGFIYTAKDPDLFTRLLQINIDPSNNKITSIYMETEHHDFWEDKSQKLLYVPLRVIQIQESENGLMSKGRELRVEYRFLNDERNIF